MDQTDLSLEQVLALKKGTGSAIINVDEPTTKLVIFVLGDDWFAFPGEQIKEVLSHNDVFFLPGCPPSLEGVINVRGDIESVINLQSTLRLPKALPAAGSRILLGQGSTMRSGIRVDRVEEVMDVLQSAIQPPPHTIPEHLQHIVVGILTFRDRRVTVLDLDRIFQDYSAGAL